jgi:hypothetical protein
MLARKLSKRRIANPKTLLYISGKEGLLFDAANGALTNGSTGAKNVLDYEGIVKATPANSIRKSGAVVVDDKLFTIQNITSTGWTTYSGTAPTITGGFPDPDGGNNAYKVEMVSGSLWGHQQTNGVINTRFASELYIRSDAQIKNYSIFTYNNGVGGDQTTFNVNTEWKKIRLYDRVIGHATHRRMHFTYTAAALYIYQPRSFDVSGTSKKIIPDKTSIQFSYANKYTNFNYIRAVGDSLTGAYPATLLANNQMLPNCAFAYNSYSGQTSTTIKNSFLTFARRAVEIPIIWVGRNNYSSPTTVKADIAAMIAELADPTKFVVIGIPRGNYPDELLGGGADIAIKALNADLAALYPNNFLDVERPWINAYNQNSPQDVLDFSNDITPTSLREDDIHPNAAGADLIATNVAEFVRSKNWNSEVTLTPAIIHEPATTNLYLFPRDLTNAAHVKTNCIADKTAAGIDGVLNSASVLTATANDATCLQSITSASANRVTGFFLKRITGTGTISITQDNGTTWTPVTITSAWTALPYTLPAATVTDPIIGIKMATSGDVIQVDLGQHELGSYITSPISGSRTIDSIKVPLSANVNFPQTKGIAFIKVTPQFANSATAKSLLCTSSADTDFIHDNGSGEIAINDGTNTSMTSGLGGWSAGDTLLIAAVWITDTMSVHVSKNGGAWVDSVNATYDGAFPAGANFLLCNANPDSILINAIKIKSTTKTLDKAQVWAKNNAIYEAV